jgi:uncharacterized membrane protein
VADLPASTLYQRFLGWHAADMRRVLTVVAVGLITALALVPALGWAVAAVVGWDAAACAFLAATWPIIARADGAQTRHLAAREDDTRGSAAFLLLGAGTASLLGAGLVLHLAGRHAGAHRTVLIGLAVLTVVLSWTLINTTYTLRYAHLQFSRPAAGIEFDGSTAAQPPASYRDFAYLAFTIGMTYQVSDTTLRGTAMRRAVLSHALLAYLFGVVIVAGVINLIGGLVR